MKTVPSLWLASRGSRPLVVVRQLDVNPVRRSPPPHTEPPTMSRVVFPPVDSPQKWNPPLFSPASAMRGPAKPADTAVINLELPTHSRAILSCQSPRVPFVR